MSLHPFCTVCLKLLTWLPNNYVLGIDLHYYCNYLPIPASLLSFLRIFLLSLLPTSLLYLSPTSLRSLLTTSLLFLAPTRLYRSSFRASFLSYLPLCSVAFFSAYFFSYLQYLCTLLSYLDTCLHLYQLIYFSFYEYTLYVC